MEEQERTDRPHRIRKAYASSSDRLGHGMYGFFLADDSLVKFVLESEQSCALPLR